MIYDGSKGADNANQFGPPARAAFLGMNRIFAMILARIPDMRHGAGPDTGYT